jgi:hypothetical protein
MTYSSAFSDDIEPNISKAKNRLYGYDYKELESFVRELGYPYCSIKAPYHVSRNSRGTALRFYCMLERKVVVIGCDATIDEIELPGRAAWLNDENEIIAWYDLGKVHYNNGLIEEGVFISHGGADPSGKYFVKKVRSKLLEVYSINNPNKSLASAEITSPEIYVHENQIFIFGNIDKATIKVYIFEETNQKLIKKEEVIIRKPKNFLGLFTVPSLFTAKDYNPKKREILIVDYWDRPIKSKWYVFSLEDRKLRKMGNANSVGFYLQCDIVDSVSNKFEEKRKKRSKKK